MGTTRLVYLLASLIAVAHAGYLYPRESEFREIKSLDGFWDFYIPAKNDTRQDVEDLPKQGLPYGAAKIIKMPVPASYNDITVEADLRDYVGTAWYERSFFVPLAWQNQRVYLRFASVHYLATVWVNGDFVVEHEGGHLPFEADVSTAVVFGQSNRVTVAVDNVLTNVTVPQGQVELIYSSEPDPKEVQKYTFDFFNYAGIHRPVVLYTVPNSHIADINTTSSITPQQNGYDAVITYAVDIDGNEAGVGCRINLVDGDGVIRVFQQTGCEGVLLVPNATLWWPIFMHPRPGYLYSFEAELISADGEVFDKYRLPIGIRAVSMDGNSLLINGKPIYIRGVGKHEDADIRGKGLDFPIMARDIELMKWMGVNCYRTSHYPYSEESMQMADKEGFMVIDEAPSVNTEFYSDELKFKHERVLAELIRRDKNYASTIMWSMANEPRTQHNESEPYFRYLRDAVREMDPTRPITIVIAQPYTTDVAGHLCDVLCFNRYNAWYSNDGRLETIATSVISEARAWFEKNGKPVIMAEYGGDTMVGLHRLPSFIWSEEFQSDLLSEHFKAFDLLRSEGFFIGEMIWNFADFMTNQDYTRVGGNRKGVFTRDRQPKEGAFVLRQRYLELAHELDQAPKPKRRYIRVPKHIIDEL
ncbi:beta-glucuronidase-like [Neocloeon triangulifer]|uniref:beta-glucuronidase-like n=1 Tax=Neocloeon triangulifer TaxID=2078957 RepID=UPI00286EFE09|nr:beta-glucuronidase-like [Neocloeon triangulifer]